MQKKPVIQSILLHESYKGNLLLQDQVLRDECWDEGEGQVGTHQVESDSVVHVVIGEEEVLLEEHGVESVQDLFQ